MTGKAPGIRNGAGRSSPLLRPSDLWRLPARWSFASALARAAAQDPRAFWIACRAVRTHRAMQKPLELHRYLAFLRQRRVASVLEIGSLWGGTFFAHCAVADPDATLVSVDWQPPDDAGTMASRFTAHARGNQAIHCIWHDSHSETAHATVRAALDGHPLDVLFIDGDHSLEGARRDYEMYAPLVRGGGIVAFHDIAADVPPGTGIPGLWHSIRREHPHVEFIDPVHPPHGLGIGVMLKP